MENNQQGQAVYPIMGSRQLSEAEIALINKIKALGEQTKELLEEVRQFHLEELRLNSYKPTLTKDDIRLRSEGFHQRILAGDELQLGFMRLVRAVDRRTSFC